MKNFLTLVFLIFTVSAFQAQTVYNIIQDSPNHNTLEIAIDAAELDDDLNGTGTFTVFAPTDAAFAALGQATIDALLADPTGDLATILLYHVLGEDLSSNDLLSNFTRTTLNGNLVLTLFDGIEGSCN